MKIRAMPGWAIVCAAAVAAIASVIAALVRPHSVYAGTSAFIPLGEHRSGEVLETNLSLINPYARELNVAQIHVGCGCTVATIPTRHLAQHGSIPITIKIDTRHRFGLSRFNVAVTFSDAPPAQVALTAMLAGTVDEVPATAP